MGLGLIERLPTIGGFGLSQRLRMFWLMPVFQRLIFIGREPVKTVRETGFGKLILGARRVLGGLLTLRQVVD